MSNTLVENLSITGEGRSHDRSILRSLPVWVAAFGNFVAVFVLVMFGILRNESLTSLGVTSSELLTVGSRLLNFQMAGMLIGGVLWGLMGDKRGRVSVLFGSILLYSSASILNAFVSDVWSYCALRFVAGVGLAGEFGAGVTLLSEILKKENRGVGTTLVAAMGMAGAVVSAQVGHLVPWRFSYFTGGLLGLCLLVMRAKLVDSEIFRSSKSKGSVRGNLLFLFQKKERFSRYLRCILVGIPIWFVAGILMIFAPEFAREMNIQEPVVAGTAIMTHCLFGFPGNLMAGLLSQKLKSRTKAIGLFLLVMGLFFLLFLSLKPNSAFSFYSLCALSGLGAGYFGLFVTSAAEQFGTNIRATVATTVPNFVRGSVVPLALLLGWLKNYFGLIPAATILAFVSLFFAAIALMGIKDSFNSDLDFVEE